MVFALNNPAGQPVIHYAEAPISRELPPFYYLDNFLTVLKSVHLFYDDLLSPQELGFYQRVLSLPRESQALFVRLLGRRGNYFRLSKIYYAEIPHLKRALQELVAVELIEPTIDSVLDPLSNCTPSCLFPLFSKAEWLFFLKQPELKSVRKDELLPYVEERACSEGFLQALLSDFGESIVQLKTELTFTAFKLLYFGNGRQDLTDFVLRDLGIFQYENYRLDKNTRLFSERAQIEAMLHYYQLRDALADIGDFSAEQLIAFYEDLPPLRDVPPEASFADRAINRRMQGLRFSIARQLERLDSLEFALKIYAECSASPGRERRARILVKLQKPKQAYALCENILQEGSETEKIFARQFSMRLAKTLNLERSKPVLFSPRSERVCLPQSGKLTVEQSVVEFISKSGQCYFVENQLFLGVFGLVFWPVIFASVPGAFTHEFQSAPHDLYNEDFLSSRQAQFQNAWQTLSNWLEYPQAFFNFLKTKQGIINPFVHWGFMHSDLLRLALGNIPYKHWQWVFERIWQDLRENRNGFPDLVYFPAEGGYELIEVKGPGDRLQANQKRWLEFFQTLQIPYRVVYVDWAKANPS